MTYTFAQSDVYHVDGRFQGTFDMLTGAEVRVWTGSASAAAYIDPRLEIDSACLTAHPGATLTVTAGVGNETAVSAVPEPSGYALMLAGLTAMGVVATRRNT